MTEDVPEWVKRAITLHDHFDGRITLRVAQPQPQYGTVQLNAEYKGDLISVDVNATDLLAALGSVLAPGSGRPLGAASGGDPGFWERLGVDDGGLPTHLPMGVTESGQGPENDSEAHHYVCWCGDVECPLTLGLGHAWKAGRRG